VRLRGEIVYAVRLGLKLGKEAGGSCVAVGELWLNFELWCANYSCLERGFQSEGALEAGGQD
jgi:hypothetical protein